MTRTLYEIEEANAWRSRTEKNWIWSFIIQPQLNIKNWQDAGAEALNVGGITTILVNLHSRWL